MSETQELSLLPTPSTAAEDVEHLGRAAGTLVVGLTGPFGSGCSTAAHLLSTAGEPRFHLVKLSHVLREMGKNDADRADLQDLGNRLRREQGNEALVIHGLAPLFAGESPTHIVLDGIRNLGEVRWLRKAFGERFGLVAVTADATERFARRDGIQSTEEFYELDRRDQGEDADHGQQVGRCVDHADVLIPNGEHLSKWDIPTFLEPKIRDAAELIAGTKHRYPSADEMLMHVAYSSSHGSKCIKRQVGAVIARGTEPIAAGYNENPDGLRPCIDQFGTCYRDVVRADRFSELASMTARCPFCSHPIPERLPQPWDCTNCGKSLDRAFFPDRAMKWCTALHAEERALINAGRQDLSDCTLYTTTFPCMLCAEKIIHAGIREIVYVEAYPDVHGLILFGQAHVSTRRFDGVRSRNFDVIFSATQPEMEAKGHQALRKMTGLP